MSVAKFKEGDPVKVLGDHTRTTRYIRDVWTHSNGDRGYTLVGLGSGNLFGEHELERYVEPVREPKAGEVWRIKMTFQVYLCQPNPRGSGCLFYNWAEHIWRNDANLYGSGETIADWEYVTQSLETYYHSVLLRTVLLK